MSILITALTNSAILYSDQEIVGGESIYKQLAVDFGPETESIEDITMKYEAIRKFVHATSRAKLSKYKGTVEMKICDKCSKLVKKDPMEGT